MKTLDESTLILTLTPLQPQLNPLVQKLCTALFKENYSMFVSFYVCEIPALGLNWGFILKVTVSYHIPTPFLADAGSDLYTVPNRNGKIATYSEVPLPGVWIAELLRMLYFPLMPMAAVLHILKVWIPSTYLKEKNIWLNYVSSWASKLILISLVLLSSTYT